MPLFFCPLDWSMMLDIQVTATVRACTFIFRSCGSSGALCLLMLHIASLLRPSLVRGWITAVLCITVSQTLISKVYRECRMLLHELIAKLHRVNITQSTYWRVILCQITQNFLSWKPDHLRIFQKIYHMYWNMSLAYMQNLSLLSCILAEIMSFV